MAKNKNKTDISNVISNYCKFLDKLVEQHDFYSNEVNRMDKLTQDYLHKLELEDLDYKERAKIATQLSKCRKARREYKDRVQLLEPIFELQKDSNSVKYFNSLRQVLGKVRKVEEYMKTRQYKFKVMDMETIDNDLF